MRHLAGVLEAKFDARKGRLDIVPSRGVVLDLAKLPEIIENASFKAMRYHVEELRVVASGTLLGSPEDRQFLIDAWPSSLGVRAETPELLEVRGHCVVEAAVVGTPGGIELRLLRVRRMP